MFLESQLEHSVYRSLPRVQPSFVGAFAFWCSFELCVTPWGWMKILRQAGSSPTWVCVWLHFFNFTVFSVYHRFVSFLASCKVPRWKFANPSCFLFLWRQSKLAWETQLWLFKMIDDVLKMWSANLYKWSYFCEEGREIKWCYTSICIYVFLYRLGEYCQNIYDKLYHCLCLYFFDCDIPHRHIDCCTFECPKFIF